MSNGKPQAKRVYRDSVFRMLFKEKKELLSLFNAIYGTEYDDPEQLEVTTLENAVYMNLKNDVSCILDFHLSLLEHQSTFNPNMPLRYVMVLQLNINEGYNQDIVTQCPALSGYIQFVSLVRENRKTMPVSEAVDHAVKECIQNGILEDFMRKNRAEVVKVSIYEYDEEKHFRTLREEGREEGRKEGREKVYFNMFHKNKTPEDISDFTGESVEYLYDLQKKYLATVHEQSYYCVKKKTNASEKEV